MAMITFDELLEKATANPSGDILGVVVKAFDRQGSRNILTKASGRRTWSSGESVQTDSTFWGFSLTKFLTTICALQCVERGQITLDEDVSTVLPELQNPQVISKQEKGGESFKLTLATTKITLRHLLTHTSGISYDAMNPLLTSWRKSRGEGLLVMSGRVKKAYSLPLLFNPGELWAYGGGVDWAGVLVERLNGNTTLGQYMEQHLFIPLDLTHTTFHLASRPDIKERLIEMSLRLEDGSLRPTSCPYPEDALDDSGGMGIVTNVLDFTTVLKDILQDEPTVLKRETVEEMFTPQFPPGSLQQKALIDQALFHQQLTGDKSGNPDVSFGIGGMIILQDVPNLPANTMTWNGMPNIGWFINRERGCGGIYASQILPSKDEPSAQLLGEFEKDMWRKFNS